jgi:hypothetical protein
MDEEESFMDVTCPHCGHEFTLLTTLKPGELIPFDERDEISKIMDLEEWISEIQHCPECFSELDVKW